METSEPILQRVRSSANMAIQMFVDSADGITCCIMSSMQMTKSMGEDTAPCGTPHPSLADLLNELLHLTLKEQRRRNPL